MSHVAVDDRSESRPDRERGAVPHLGWVAAGASAAAGVIHLAMAPVHADAGLTDPLGFAVVGWFQLTVAALILVGKDHRRLYAVALLGNLAVSGLWVWSRTVGLPLGSHAGESEAVGAVDLAAVGLQAVVVLVAARILLASERPSIGRVAPAMAAVAALGLATVVLASPETASHGGGGHTHGDSATGDHHGSDGDHSDLMAQIDAVRCDRDFNHDSYWEEAEYLGVDTYFGGAMSADEHSHAAEAPEVEPDPTGGRGSVGLDVLVQYTSLAGGGELSAAQMVAQLGEADDETYEAWRWWLRNKLNGGGGGHGHGETADSGAHDSHVGPQAWVAMTDQEECDTLAAELEQARAVALKYPTAGDAMDAGWVRVAPYLPGIASHFMRYEYVDGVFDIDEPEMILYDGNDRDARVVGLSYYINHDGTDPPTQGFTGPNDHFHRHIGLCQGAGGVIGDSATTAEECEALGGRKADGSRGWMNHVWIVPGCESPWGVFSAASPLLENELSAASGTSEGCAASGVRDRYGLDEPGELQAISGDAAAEPGG